MPRVEHAIGNIRKAAPARIWMRKRCKNDIRIGRSAKDGELRRAFLQTHPLVRSRFHRVKFSKVLGGSYARIDVDSWQPGWDDAPARMPASPVDWDHYAHPPRCASRYCQTTNKSATLPESMRSRALLPRKTKVWLGLRIQPSAIPGSGKRICSAL